MHLRGGAVGLAHQASCGSQRGRPGSRRGEACLVAPVGEACRREARIWVRRTDEATVRGSRVGEAVRGERGVAAPPPGRRRAEQVSDEREGVDIVLLTGPQDAHQDFLRARPGGGAISAPHRANDRGGSDRRLGPIVRRLQPGTLQIREQEGELPVEMVGQAAILVRPIARGPGAARVPPPVTRDSTRSTTSWRGPGSTNGG